MKLVLSMALSTMGLSETLHPLQGPDANRSLPRPRGHTYDPPTPAPYVKAPASGRTNEVPVCYCNSGGRRPTGKRAQCCVVSQGLEKIPPRSQVRQVHTLTACVCGPEPWVTHSARTWPKPSTPLGAAVSHSSLGQVPNP